VARRIRGACRTGEVVVNFHVRTIRLLYTYRGYYRVFPRVHRNILVIILARFHYERRAFSDLDAYLSIMMVFSDYA